MNLPEFFGLYIGNHSIKVAQIKYKGDHKAELTAIGNIESNTGIATLKEEAAKQSLADKIKQVKDSTGIGTKVVVAALPESTVFTKVINVPNLPEGEIDQAIFYEARQHIPIPVSDAQLDYIPLSDPSPAQKILQVLLVAAPKTLVNLYMEIMEKAGLELAALETETVATARTVTLAGDIQGSALTIDFGANGLDMSVIKGKNLIFSQSLGTGSDALSKAIASDFGLEYSQAEQYKRTYGLLKDQAEGKIYRSIQPVMQVIVNEVNKTINYFRTYLQESTPTKILLVGDGAKLPGLPEFLKEQLGIDAQLIDPVASLEINGRIKSEVAQLSTVGFTVAVGLALKKE